MVLSYNKKRHYCFCLHADIKIHALQVYCTSILNAKQCRVCAFKLMVCLHVAHVCVSYISVLLKVKLIVHSGRSM